MFGYPDAHNIGSDGYADAISFVTDAYTLGCDGYPNGVGSAGDLIADAYTVGSDGDSYPDGTADGNPHAHANAHVYSDAQFLRG
jgi:hypothetical protein